MNLREMKNTLQQPPRILLYGIAGTGKSTFATFAPDPFYIDLEKTLSILGKGDISHISEWLESDGSSRNLKYEDIIYVLENILAENYNFKTLVIDTIDSLDELVVEYTLRKNKWDKLDYSGFGAKYKAKHANWNVIFNLLDNIWSQKHMCILMLGHSKIKSINEPNLPTYNAYSLNLEDEQLNYITKISDVVSFVDIKKFASQDGNRVQTSTTEERVMHLHPHPAYLAKSRYKDMPSMLPLDWYVFVKYLSN